MRTSSHFVHRFFKVSVCCEKYSSAASSESICDNWYHKGIITTDCFYQKHNYVSHDMNIAYFIIIQYCKFGNFREGFCFVKEKPSRNGEISMSFTDIGKSCPTSEFLSSQICI